MNKKTTSSITALVNTFFTEIQRVSFESSRGILKDLYLFSDETLLLNALLHTSFINEMKVNGNLSSNEKLEFLGDSIIGMIVAIEIFKRYPSLNEGELSKFKSFLVNEEMLSNLALGIGLEKCILLGVGENKTGGNLKRSILGDCLEALFGAVYVDSNFKVTYDFFINVIEAYNERFDTNYFCYEDSLDYDDKSRLYDL